MILYNVTMNVEAQIVQDWLCWMKETHIPQVMETGCFTEYKFLKLLNDDPDAMGATYAVQFFATEVGALEKYLNDFAQAHHQLQHGRYQSRVVAFRTFLEEI